MPSLLSAQLGRQTCKRRQSPPPPRGPGSRPGLLGRGCLFYSPNSLHTQPIQGAPLLSCQLSVTPSSPFVLFSLNRKVGSPPHPSPSVPLVTSPHPRRSSQAWGGPRVGTGVIQPVCCEGRDFLLNSVLL
ncbi:hypothetical protein mRhiFer1_008638 [Rhinolophus ferrumequinum]|uniref:Uncharacterized protein n=1 Tax=Rhinolophus ferrumequinum TaxID=59479 RepID=A0A7J7U128_RHIFE|nr:hypothetical protein mRhiFer1_008638 [Rhinolophus ferrumequinum]